MLPQERRAVLSSTPSRFGPLAASSRQATWIALAGALAFAVWLAPHPMHGNGDTVWLLMVAERWLDGAKPYVDVLETNPPMSIMLYLPAAWLGRATGIGAEFWLHGQVTLLALAALAIVAHTSTGGEGGAGRAGLAVLAVTAFAFLLLPSRSFGQREHIAAVALTPYLFVIAARWGRPAADATAEAPAVLRLASGLLAGLALSIKPHFAFVLIAAHGWLAVAAARRASQGSVRRLAVSLAVELFRQARSIEAVAAILCFAAYVVVALRVFPEFWSVMYPRLALVYLPARLDLVQLVTVPALLSLALMAMLVARIRPRPVSPLLGVMTAAACGGAMAMLAQGKGWAYHMLPAATFAVIAAGTALRGMSAAQSGGIAPVALVVVGAALLPFTFSRYETHPGLERALTSAGERPVVLIGSVSLEIFPILRRIDGVWAGRSASLWMTNGAAGELARHHPDPERRGAIEGLARLDREMFVEAALGRRPDILAFEAPEPSRDLAEWALSDLRMVELLRDYRPGPPLAGWRIWVKGREPERLP